MDTNYIQEVTEIFKDYFGNDRVELKTCDEGYDIIVYFPSVTVTNENNQSVVIKDLFAKVPIQANGKLLRSKFSLMRTTYTVQQAQSGYTHSHVSSTTPLGDWGSPCLGTGPINNTIRTLEDQNCDFEELKTFWRLFCVELDEYTQVESLTGGPYIRLSSIGADRSQSKNRNFIETLSSLRYHCSSTPRLEGSEVMTAKHILRSGKIKFHYTPNGIQLGMSDTEFAILATKAAYDVFTKTHSEETLESFIRYFNCETYILNQGRLCSFAGRNSHRLNRVGSECIMFNGKSFKLKIVGNDEHKGNYIIILSDRVLAKLKGFILHIVNATYGKRNVTKDAYFI